MEVLTTMHRFKTYLTQTKDNERRSTPVHSALFIKISLLKMSGLGCVIPSNCYSMTVGRCECSVCFGKKKKKRPRKRESEYVHDKGMYKGSWHRIPGA